MRLTKKILDSWTLPEFDKYERSEDLKRAQRTYDDQVLQRSRKEALTAPLDPDAFF